MKRVIIEFVLSDDSEMDALSLAEHISDELAVLEVEGDLPDDIAYWTVDSD